MLVLGGRGPRGLRGRLSRSVSGQVAAHAPCPVVMVRPRDAVDARPSPPRVVVGVDEPPSCTAAVGFAFHAACQRGVPVVALHAWIPDPPGDLEAVTGPSALAEAVAGRVLDRALDRWRSAFADVSVHTVLVRGEPAHALLAESHGAALLVIGTRQDRDGWESGVRFGQRHRSAPQRVPARDHPSGHRSDTAFSRDPGA